MKIFKKEPDFKFMNKKYLAFMLSGLIILAGFYTFFTKGFNLGIDFSGGTMIEVSFKNNINENYLREKLNKVGLGQSVIQRAGKEENKFFIKSIKDVEKFKTNVKSNENISQHEKVAVLIKESLMTEDQLKMYKEGKLDLNNASEKKITDLLTSNGILSDDAVDAAKKIIDLRKNEIGLISDFKVIENLGLKNRIIKVLKNNSFLGDFTFLSVEIVGPQVGADLRKKATLATVWAMIGMLIYIAFRFRFIYGVAAVITLLHDVLISLSFILFFNIEISLTVVAALLTLVGYSLNDTIVIFDRVRDNLKLMRKDNAENILDKSINQTLSRTIVTSGTTLLTVLSLFFLGGEVIHSFAFTLLVGIIVGTYSSIYQSCAWLKIWERFFLKRKKI